MSFELNAMSLEQGLLETLQLYVIAGACVMYFYCARMVSSEGVFHHSLRSFATICALSAIVLFGRETSWGSAYEMSHFMSDIIEFIMGVTLVVYALYTSFQWYKNENNVIGAIRYVADIKMISIFSSIALCFVVSALFDKAVIVTPFSVFIEEICELAAYMLFFVSGYIFYKKLTATCLAHK